MIKYATQAKVAQLLKRRIGKRFNRTFRNSIWNYVVGDPKLSDRWDNGEATQDLWLWGELISENCYR